MKHVVIFTDGACRGNPGRGGWAALLRYGKHEKAIFGAESHTTNNRMELMAAIQALHVLKQSCKIELYTDSQYLKKGITEWISVWKKKNWKTAAKKPVKNADLWEELEKLASKHTMHWHWVKAHNGHLENETVDRLANQAIDKLIK
jgi:ribonuclease HI